MNSVRVSRQSTDTEVRLQGLRDSARMYSGTDDSVSVSEHARGAVMHGRCSTCFPVHYPILQSASPCRYARRWAATLQVASSPSPSRSASSPLAWSASCLHDNVFVASLQFRTPSSLPTASQNEILAHIGRRTARHLSDKPFCSRTRVIARVRHV